MYRYILCILLITSFCVLKASGQTAVDSATAPSSIKTLTLKQYHDYTQGPDLIQHALPATLNRYPMPDDVLHLKKELALSADQVKKIKAVSDYLKLKKTEIGQSVIRNEKKLDDLFRAQKVDEGSIAFYGNRYGLYEGEYRTSVLMACYNTYNVLTPQQTSRFWKLKKP